MGNIGTFSTCLDVSSSAEVKSMQISIQATKNNITRILFCSSIFVSLKEKMLSRVGNLK